MFHMINKRALLVEVWCTFISLNFYLFQNNFATLGSQNGFCSPKKVSLGGPGCGHPRHLPLGQSLRRIMRFIHHKLRSLQYRFAVLLGAIVSRRLGTTMLRYYNLRQCS